MKYDPPRRFTAGTHPHIGTDIPELLRSVWSPDDEFHPTFIFWENNNPKGAFSRKYIACVNGCYADDDDADLALHRAAQLYVWKRRASKEPN